MPFSLATPGQKGPGDLNAEAAAALSRELEAAAFKRCHRLLNGYEIPGTRRRLLAIPPADAIVVSS